MNTALWPSSWKARIRWSGIPRPTWMSGEVTSMPSFTRSGRPSFSFASSPPSGSTWTALRVSSASPMAAASLVRPPAIHAVGGRTGRRATVTISGFSCRVSPASSRILVPSSKISNQMKLAIVAVEDKRFYEHRGVDLHGILRAVLQDLRHKKVVEGGSTITQQLIKNTYLHNQRSIGRKLREAAYAWQLEQRWSKDRILTAYLNTIYFGNGAYGVQQAALTYFHHGANKLG